VSFQEITREAVQASISNPRPLDRPMVDSALVRKFLDRLVGFRTSKMAAAVAGRGSSMGRVQTPTLGFVVDRELEREAFVPTRYFEVRAAAQGVKLKASAAPVYAYFDPPWTPPLLRRNEVMLRVDQ
jgi:DNA topoisomerase-1